MGCSTRVFLFNSLQVSLYGSSSIPTHGVGNEPRPERQKWLERRIRVRLSLNSLQSVPVAFWHQMVNKIPENMFNQIPNYSRCTVVRSPCSCTRMKVPSCTALSPAVCVQHQGKLPISRTHANKPQTLKTKLQVCSLSHNNLIYC